MKRSCIAWHLVWCLLLLGGLLPLRAHAQFTPTLVLEYAPGTIDADHLNGFFDTFNAFWARDAAQPFESVGAEAFQHLQWGGGLRFIVPAPLGVVLSTTVTRGTQRVDRSFVYANGFGHDLEMNTRDVSWDVQVGLVLARYLTVTGVMDGYFRKMNYRLYSRFQDGSRSLGNVYKISGVYTGINSSIDLGVGVGLILGPVLLNVTWTQPLPDFPPGQGLVTMDDYDTDEFPPTSFPVDYALWATDPVGFAEAEANDEEVALLTDRLKGTRLTFGIELLLSKLFF